ncbi:signal transduction histidine kinase regulating citrate/malate metabolism [Kineococcus radiotolerans SRS30216 = ATCC BAA-149]|uniref:histidine kinase n=1 Tax=Kineococcus radiotolerans (strain ATCC BAA-149 / DSM 14245 / SRS30216) TaxID=266940 RepID=A6W417_KINRD|nr:signal transduction histidine kinase regulating citrate/malate metabolism [Kineococcus radiotolerans SRS30216 = ATCC BAA-149]
MGHTDPVRRSMPLGLQLFLLQLGIVVLTVTIAGLLAVHLQQDQIREAYQQRVLTVARATAGLPSVVDAYDDPDPAATLQPLAELLRQASGTTFVVLSDVDGVRYSHPDPARIGQRVSTDPSPTLAGQVFVGTETGTLGESLRAKVPVRDASGRVVGAASVGVLERELADDLREDVPVLVAWMGGAALLGTAASFLVARLVRRRTHGLEPEEIGRLLETRDAMLHGIREGVLAVDRRGTLVLANDEALRLLDLGADPTGRAAADVLDGHVLDLVTGPRDVVDEPLLAGERLLVVNRTSAVVSGRQVAHLLTLRDRTELSGAVRELDSQRSLTATLRAQAHEFANHLHVVQGLLELGHVPEASSFIDRIGGGGDLVSAGGVLAVRDPETAALLLAKAAVARERGCRVSLDPASALDDADPDLLTVLGNLVDNAVDAAGAGGTVLVSLSGDAEGVRVRVDDDGPGVPAAGRAAVFAVGYTTKAGRDLHGRGIGLALVARIAARRHGRAEVGESPLGGARFEVELPRARVGAR